MYEVGELSIIMVSFKSRPICERSYTPVSVQAVAVSRDITYLHVIALVVVTAFTEKSVVYDTVDIELVKEGITVLQLSASSRLCTSQVRGLTLDTDAVNTTTSYSSPTLFMN